MHGRFMIVVTSAEEILALRAHLKRYAHKGYAITPRSLEGKFIIFSRVYAFQDCCSVPRVSRGLLLLGRVRFRPGAAFAYILALRNVATDQFSGLVVDSSIVNELKRHIDESMAM